VTNPRRLCLALTALAAWCLASCGGVKKLDPRHAPQEERAAQAEKARREAELAELEARRRKANEELLAARVGQKELADERAGRKIGAEREKAQLKAARAKQRAGLLDVEDLREGESGRLPELPYKVVGVDELKPDGEQRHVQALLHVEGTKTFLVVSGIDPDRAAEGKPWRPEKGALFSVLAPQTTRSGKVFGHVAQHPDSRATSKAK
jgi:hypothetical protein